MSEALRHSGAALAGITLAFLFFFGAYGHGRLDSFRASLYRRVQQATPGRRWTEFLTHLVEVLWPHYLLAGLFTMGFGNLIGPGIKPDNADNLVPLFTSSFVSMCAIAVVRLAVTFFSGSPSLIGVWFMASIASGSYGMLAKWLPEGSVITAVGDGEAIPAVVLGSVAICCMVEFLIFSVAWLRDQSILAGPQVS